MAGKPKRASKAIEAIAREEAAQSPESIDPLSPEEAKLMLHELQVHQIELEMQNEELRHTQVELHAARARYFDLYDLAPVGYCTLNEKGLILQANLAAAAQLGLARGALVKQLFTRFILKADQDIYYLQRKQLLESGGPRTWELRMVKSDGTQIRTHLAATTAQGANDETVIRIVMMACTHP